VSLKIVNKTKGVVIAAEAEVANSFLSRGIGLMFRREIGIGGLVFYYAPSIHTFFMCFAIDVIFLNQQMEVIKICSEVKPWRIVNCWRSAVTLELPAGKALSSGTKVGDILELVSS
jgi:uncharacterized membrane protein (UPF0127 family)